MDTCNWTPCDRAPITGQIGAHRTNQIREFCNKLRLSPKLKAGKSVRERAPSKAHLLPSLIGRGRRKDLGKRLKRDWREKRHSSKISQQFGGISWTRILPVSLKGRHIKARDISLKQLSQNSGNGLLSRNLFGTFDMWVLNCCSCPHHLSANIFKITNALALQPKLFLLL